MKRIVYHLIACFVLLFGLTLLSYDVLSPVAEEEEKIVVDACRGQALSCPHALDAHTCTSTFISLSKEIDCFCFSKKRLRLRAYRRMQSPPRYDSWGVRQPQQSGGHGRHVHGREISQDCPGSDRPACIQIMPVTC